MKQYRITTKNLPEATSDDCYLAPEDPVHEIIATQIMDGLGSQARLDAYRLSQYNDISNNKGQIQKDQHIKPGAEEWFKLWFGK